MLARRIANRMRRGMQRRWLAALHARGARRESLPEAPEPSILRLAERLRADALDGNRERFAGTPWRFLLCKPRSFAADVWFTDLTDGMRYAGIPVRCLPPLATVDGALLDEFRPTVVVALDEEQALESIDLVALREYKRRHGCLRLFISTRTSIFSPEVLTADDARRLQRAIDGNGGDAFMTLYDPESFPRLYPEWVDAGFRSISVPQSANPAEDYPRDVMRVHDYFYTSVCTNERLRATWDELRPILWGYRGDWAGEGWGFGDGPIPPVEMPVRYGGSRISLAPLLLALRRHPFELTHRVYEAAACGAFQISSLSPVTRRAFTERALVCARDGADFVKLFGHFVSRPDERNRIVEQALVELYAAHTVFHRIEALLAALEPLATLA